MEPRRQAPTALLQQRYSPRSTSRFPPEFATSTRLPAPGPLPIFPLVHPDGAGTSHSPVMNGKQRSANLAGCWVDRPLEEAVAEMYGVAYPGAVDV